MAIDTDTAARLEAAKSKSANIIRLQNTIKELHDVKHDGFGWCHKDCVDRGKQELIADAERELAALVAPAPTPPAPPPETGWELIAELNQAFGIFIGEGDDGASSPWCIFSNREDADRFVSWQVSLPEDDQMGDLHVMEMRFVDGEFWNHVGDVNFEAPRLARD